MQALAPLGKLAPPPTGWIKAIRSATGMSMQQLANKLNISRQGVMNMGKREKEGSITIKSLREIALRFKHRLVSIHCFPNGNGRHSRLMADLVIEKIFKRAVFSWGSYSKNESSRTDTRLNYLRALKFADSGDYNHLLAFARS